MLIRRLGNIVGIICLILALDFLFGWRLSWSISYKTQLITVGWIYAILLMWRHKRDLEQAAQKIVISKNIFLFLEMCLMVGIFYFLSQELVSAFLSDQHWLTQMFHNLSDKLFFYLTMFSGLILILAQKDNSSKTVKPANKFLVSSLLIASLLIGTSLRAYKLGAEDMKGDEFQVIAAAAGYLHTGQYYSWNWVDKDIACDNCFYERAWPHTWMVAQSYRIFGISEASARIPSVILGSMTILIAFYFSYFATRNIIVSLVVASLVAINPAFISLARYTRMYVLLIPLFLLLLYALYRSLTETSPTWLTDKIKQLPNKLARYWQNHFNFNWGMVLLALILLYFNFHTHINSLVALPAIALFIIYLFCTQDRRRYIYPTLAIVTAVVAIILFYDPDKLYFHNFLSPFTRNNQSYLNHILNYPFAWQLTLALNLMSLLFAYKKRRQFMIYMHFILWFGVIFFVYVADRYSSYVYSSHLVILAMLGGVDGAWQIWQMIRLRAIKWLLAILLFITLFLQVLKIDPNRYDSQGSAQHSVAYQHIVDNYDVKKDLLFMQYPRDFYLRELDGAEIFDMKSHKALTLEELLEHIENNKQENSKLWIIFESGKRGHLSEEVLSYIETNFDKIHGQEIDRSGVEVFYAENF